jgi:hypothetical protein
MAAEAEMQKPSIPHDALASGGDDRARENEIRRRVCPSQLEHNLIAFEASRLTSKAASDADLCRAQDGKHLIAATLDKRG